MAMYTYSPFPRHYGSVVSVAGEFQVSSYFFGSAGVAGIHEDRLQTLKQSIAMALLDVEAMKSPM